MMESFCAIPLRNEVLAQTNIIIRAAKRCSKTVLHKKLIVY